MALRSVKSTGHPLMQRRRASMIVGITLLGAGVFLFLIVNADPTSNAEDRTVVGILSGFMVAAGVILLAAGRRLPTAEILRLAQSQGGMLTLSDIVTTLGISPSRALKALKELQKTGIASQRWQEVRKNVWEFPDYLPAEALELPGMSAVASAKEPKAAQLGSLADSEPRAAADSARMETQ